MKMGDKGSFIYGEGICQMVPTFKVEAVDPTAAGDCFTGVLVKQFTETGDIVAAARYASAAAAISVQHLAHSRLCRQKTPSTHFSQSGHNKDIYRLSFTGSRFLFVPKCTEGLYSP